MKRESIKKNTFYNTIKYIASTVFPLITFPYISRVLMKENVGKVNFGLSVVSYFSLISTLGITLYAVRECAAARNDQKKLNDISSQILSINILSTTVAYALLAVTLLFFKKVENYRLLIIIQSLSIIFTTLGADWLNLAMEDFRYIALRTVGFQVLALVLMFTLIHKPDDYMKYAIISLVASSGANIVNMWYRKKYCVTRFTWKIEWKTHLKPIMLLFAMLLAQNILSNVDVTMLGLMWGDATVGIYTTAQKLNSFVSAALGSILWVVMPRISLFFAEDDYEQINLMCRKVLGFFCLVGFPCVTGMFSIARDVILVGAGADYIKAAPVLQILSISTLISLFAGGFLGNIVLLPAKKEQYCMIVTLTISGINVLTNYLLIPRYGAIGAATTTSCCTLLSLVMYVLYIMFKFDKRFKLTKIYEVFISPIIGCAAIFFICRFFSNIENLALRVSISIIISMLAYFCIQVILKNEIVLEACRTGINSIRRIRKAD